MDTKSANTVVKDDFVEFLYEGELRLGVVLEVRDMEYGDTPAIAVAHIRPPHKIVVIPEHNVVEVFRNPLLYRTIMLGGW